MIQSGGNVRLASIPDERYSIAVEYCGETHSDAWLKPGQAYVVRFCGEWVGKGPTKAAAEEVARDHDERRDVR